MPTLASDSRTAVPASGIPNHAGRWIISRLIGQQHAATEVTDRIARRRHAIELGMR